jgi:hypothetical protein
MLYAAFVSSESCIHRTHSIAVRVRNCAVPTGLEPSTFYTRHYRAGLQAMSSLRDCFVAAYLGASMRVITHSLAASE